MRSRLALHKALVVLGIAVFAACGFAQPTGGRIVGHIADPSGANVAGAKVTLANDETGVTHISRTDASGEYSALQLPVGSYSMTIERAGFKKNVRQGVRLELNQVLTVDAVLQVGSREELVDVTGAAALVDTTSTQLGVVVDEREVVKLPLNARDTYQLLQLQPGVQGVGGSDLFFGSNQSGAVSVNGGRGRSNNFSVNGGDGNDLFVNSPAIQPTPDSIQEFRVLTNTFDAEYGRNSGAVINVVTKSGTNHWHGGLYEFLRNQSFNAKGFLDLRRPDDKQNQFGGTFGGPLKKDRTFFFSSYEGRRVIHGISSDPVVVPTAAERQGNFSASPLNGSVGTDALASILNARCGLGIPLPSVSGPTPYASIFPNSAIPAKCFDPAAVSILNRFVPCPNSDPTCSNLSNTNNIFRSIPNEDSSASQFTLKIDHTIGEKQSLNGYYYFNDSSDAQPFTRFQAATPNLLQGFGDNNAARSQQLNITDTWTPTPSSVNEARITYFREAQGTFLHPQHTGLVTNSCSGAAAAFCFTGATDVPSVIPANPKFGITPGLGPNHEGVPFIDIAGGFTIGNDFEGELPQIGNTYQFSDNFTKVAGAHTTKFGLDFRNQRFFQTLFFAPNGDFSYAGGGPNDPLALRTSGQTQTLFPNFLFGLPDTYLQGSTQSEDVRGNSLYLFAQDSWKVRSNLTFNYGLRWEYNQPFYDAGGRYQTFRPGQATTTFPCQLGAANPLNPTFNTPGATPVSCNPGSGNEAVFPLGLVVPGDRGVPKGLTSAVYNAFAPRLGAAWDPWKDGKTSIHAGFGIFYNPIEQLVLEQFQGEPPFGGSSTLSETFFSTPFVSQGCTPIPCGQPGGQGIQPNVFNGIITPAPGQPVDFSLFRPTTLFGELQPHLHAQYSNQYNLGIQHELGKEMVLSVGYVGTQAHHLLATHDLNFGNAQTCLDIIATLGPAACAPFSADKQFVIPGGTVIAPQGLHLPYNAGAGGLFVPGGTTVGPAGITLVGLRPFSSPFCQPFTGTGCPSDGIPVFSSIFAQDTIASSNYNALQASLEKRFSQGVQLQISYTFSKSIDDASSFENTLRPVCDGPAAGNRCNRSLSLFDARQRLVASYLWDLPVPKYGHFKGKVLDGWSVSGITSLQTGFPIRLNSSADQELENSGGDFEPPGKPDLIAPFRTFDPRTHNGQFFDPASFQLAALGTVGTAPRTICCGPGIANFDFSIQKVMPAGEGRHLEFRTEFFNLFNHTQFLNPDGNISDGQAFGLVEHTRDPRNIQFALKFAF